MVGVIIISLVFCLIASQWPHFLLDSMNFVYANPFVAPNEILPE
jgi:hypothetical protein